MSTAKLKRLGSATFNKISGHEAMEKAMNNAISPLQESMQRVEESLARLTAKVDTMHGGEVPLFTSSMDHCLSENPEATLREAFAKPRAPPVNDGPNKQRSKLEELLEEDSGQQDNHELDSLDFQDSNTFVSIKPCQASEDEEKRMREEARFLAQGHKAEEEIWLVTKMKEWVEWFDSIKEPERKGLLNTITTSPVVEYTVSSVIMFNSLFVAFTSDWEMSHLGQPFPQSILGMELFFIIFYTAEIILRLANHGKYFFVNKEMMWNWMDFFLVLISLYDIGFTLIVVGSGGSKNVASIRVLRLFRLAKIGRTLRVMRVFRDLTLIVSGFTQSIVPLFWCFVMLTFVIYVFALIFVQGLAGWLTTVISQEEITADPSYVAIMDNFGTVGQSMLTLYMSVTGGNDWAEYYEIVAVAGELYAGLYLFFTFFFVFSLFNILTSVFVEKVVVAAEPDRQHVILEQRRQRIKEAEELKHVCHLLDEDGTGTISKQEFMKYMESESMKAYMTAIGLEVRDITLFFDMVSSAAQAEEINIDKFVDGCLSMKGNASAVDMQKQMFMQANMQERMDKFEQTMNFKLSRLSGLMRDVRRSTRLHGPAPGAHEGDHEDRDPSKESNVCEARPFVNGDHASAGVGVYNGAARAENGSSADASGPKAASWHRSDQPAPDSWGKE